MEVREQVPLAPLTTLRLGGPARFFVEARDDATAIEAVRWASERDLEVHCIGGGSNLVVCDEGVDGLVLRMAQRGLRWQERGGETWLTAAAGEPWDDLVARTVERDLAGLECLSGIPGTAGATPIQNVGAYGQEVSERIRAVRVLDRRSLRVVELPPERCGFGYRQSAFKRAPDRWAVLGVTFALTPGGAPATGHTGLRDRLAAGADPTLRAAREAVLALRASRSMLLDPADENRRSAGSFFTNPILPDADADRVVARAVADGLVSEAAEVPRWPAGDGRTKLAAGWLIERAGVPRGYRRGAVGVSSKHALALVHHGGGTTRELLALARHVRDAVSERFGVALAIEPTKIGFEQA